VIITSVWDGSERYLHVSGGKLVIPYGGKPGYPDSASQCEQGDAAASGRGTGWRERYAGANTLMYCAMDVWNRGYWEPDFPGGICGSDRPHRDKEAAARLRKMVYPYSEGPKEPVARDLRIRRR